MKNTSVSLFRQVLDLIPKREFEEIIMKHSGDRRKQTFDSWAHFVSMIFCQLAQANSLREICGGLKTCGGKLNHLGVEEAPSKSNLSYANQHRDLEIFKALFFMLLKHCKAVAPSHEFSFKRKLYSLDATLIELCVRAFPWATYRQTKGAIKLNMLLDHDGYLPVFMDFTHGDVHEVISARQMDLPRDSIVVCDRGYVDYEMLYKWNLNVVRNLYQIEREAKERAEKKGTETALFQERKTARRVSQKLVAEFFEQAKILRDSERPTSPVAKAVVYALNIEAELKKFLEDSRLNIDNNPAERLNRGVAIIRENSLFAGSNPADSGWRSSILLPHHAKRTTSVSANGLKTRFRVFLQLRQIKPNPCCRPIGRRFPHNLSSSPGTLEDFDTDM